MKLKTLFLACIINSIVAFSQATLPTYCSDFNVALPTGWTQTETFTQPTHDNCSGPSKRFNAVGNSLTINFTGVANSIKYSISRNNPDNKTLVIEESPNGISWTTVFTHTTVNTPVPAEIHTRSILPTSQYVRFRMSVRIGGRMEIDMVNIYNTTPHPSGDCELLNLNCLNAYAICSDVSFSGNTDDFGAQEVNGTNRGCLSDENQSNWFYFEPQVGGTMEFLISAGAGVDYDFAIWTGTCASLGTPVRCSWAATTVPTGLSSSALDLSEGASGDALVAPLTLTVGQTYILFIDNWTANNTPFTIDFTLSGGASLDCTPTPLSIELINFNGEIVGEDNLLTWTTVNESNNDYFTLERSRNGFDFEELAIVDGAGNSNGNINYAEYDLDPYAGITYYRLKQTDFDGTYTYSQTIALDRGLEEAILSELFPNPANNSVNFTIQSPKSKSLTINMYDNTGRLITQELKDVVKGSNTFNLDINYLAKGIYTIAIQSDLFEKIEIKQFVKQ